MTARDLAVLYAWGSIAFACTSCVLLAAAWSVHHDWVTITLSALDVCVVIGMIGVLRNWWSKP